MKTCTTLVVLFLGATFAEFVSYKGYKVYKIQTSDNNVLEFLQELEGNPEYDFWTEARSSDATIDVMVAPRSQDNFEELLDSFGVHIDYLHEDLENAITNERIQQERLKQTRNNSRLEFNQYYRFGEINEYLHQLELTYPQLLTLEDIGTSLEGREMLVAKISTRPSTTPKPIILIDGGIHAREWISPATVTYILDQLVTNSNNLNLIQDVDWYILPVLNPDGYEYTHTDARMWRKNRSPGFFCWGTDLNRNYDYFWGTTGTSTQECSDIFHGPSPASEKETIVYATFVEKYASRIKLYLSFHSYGNYFLYPWGYINSAAPNGDAMDAIAVAAADAIVAAGGPRYTVGVSSLALYPTAGDSTDWALGAAGIPYSYTVELPQNSFIVPPENILGIARQTFEGMRVFGEYIRAQYA